MSVFNGVGDPSYQNMINAVNAAFPNTFPSELSYDGGGYHATGNAVDFSNGGSGGTPQMDQLAQWIASNYGTVSLEIIHVNQDGSTVEYKNGQQEPTGWYGASTLAEHHNHVHWAITNAGLAQAGAPSAAGDSSGSAPGNGKINDIFSADFWKRVGIGAAGVAAALIGLDITKRGINV